VGGVWIVDRSRPWVTLTSRWWRRYGCRVVVVPGRAVWFDVLFVGSFAADSARVIGSVGVDSISACRRADGDGFCFCLGDHPELERKAASILVGGALGRLGHPGERVIRSGCRCCCLQRIRSQRRRRGCVGARRTRRCGDDVERKLLNRSASPAEKTVPIRTPSMNRQSR